MTKKTEVPTESNIEFELKTGSLAASQAQTDSACDRVLSPWRALPPLERLIVAMLAISGNSIERYNLIRFAAKIKERLVPSDKPISRSFVTGTLKAGKITEELVQYPIEITIYTLHGLVKKGFLLKPKTDHFIIDPKIGGYIVHDLLKTGNYKHVRMFLVNFLPRSQSALPSSISYDNGVRETTKTKVIGALWDYLYSGAIRPFQKTMEYYIVNASDRSKDISRATFKNAMIAELYESPFDLAWFRLLPRDLQLYYLSWKMQYAITSLTFPPEWIKDTAAAYTQTVTKYTKTDTLFNAYIQYVLLTQDQEELKRIRQVRTSVKGFVPLLDATSLLLSGKVKEACVMFQKARELSQNAKMTPAFPPFFELMYYLTGLATKDGHMKAFMSLILSKYGDIGNYDIWGVFCRMEQDVRTISNRKYDYPEVLYESDGIPYIMSKLVDVGITTLYKEKVNNALAQDYLDSIIKRDGKHPFTWISNEANALLAKMTSPSKTKQGFLASLVIFSGRWDVLKEMIKTLSVKAGDSDKTQDNSGKMTRLTWRFDSKYDDITPYEQTRRADGSWTAGRKVGMQRIYEQWRNWDYLCEQDIAICRGMSCITERSYHGYPETSYNFGDNCLLNLVGHPLVFSEANPDQRIEFTTEKPVLEVVQVDNRSCIVMTPFPEDMVINVGNNEIADYDYVMTVLQGKNRYQLVRFEKIHLNLARLLTKKGLSVPLGRESEIGEMLHPLLSNFAVKLDSQTSELVGDVASVDTLDSDSRIILRLVPENDTLTVETVVCPFGEGKIFCTPGGGAEFLCGEKNGKQVGTHRQFNKEKDNIQTILNACPSMNEARLSATQYLFDTPEKSLEFLSQLESLISVWRIANDDIASQKKGTRKRGTRKNAAVETESSDEPVPPNEIQFAPDSPMVIHWPHGHRIHVSSPVSFGNLRMSVSSAKEWFEASGSIHVDCHDLDLAQFLLAMNESSNRFVKINENEYIALTDEFRKRLDQFRYCTSLSGKKVQIHPLAVAEVERTLLGDASQSLCEWMVPDRWNELKERFAKAEATTVRIPRSFQGELRDYQQEGVQWLARLAAFGAGACLADDMGLGKTIQAIVLLLLRAKQGPALVVAPTSVCSNWERELNRFAPSLHPIRVASSAESGSVGKDDRADMIKNAKPFDVFITNYSILQIESDCFADVQYSTIILDEAQAIKNFDTDRAKAAMRLQGDFRLITTGTPIENHLGELWSLFLFINPGFLGPRRLFDQRFTIPIQRDASSNARQRLKSLVRPFVLRRFKSDVLQELPGRTDIELEVEFSREESALYEAIRKNALKQLEETAEEPRGRRQVRILAELMKLRRMCCDSQLVLPDSKITCSKLDLLDDTVRDMLDNNHKILVFSQFTDYLKRIAKRMDDQKISYQYLDGTMTQNKRQQAVDAFQAGDSDVFLISLKAGGVGLNLTAADYVIHMDPWWNPAVENQASDRAHRIGQKRPVTVYRMITKGTIEEKIRELHQRKEQLAHDILADTDTPITFSLEEMMALLREPL